MPQHWWEWGVLAVVVLVVGGTGVAFFLYLRAAYRKGGWREVRAHFIIAIIALAALYVVRVAENSDLQQLKDAVHRLTR